MRLWHVDLIPYLPNSQLVAQWRELCLIYSTHLNHILINYIYNYGKDYLYCYSQVVIQEISKRNIKINKQTLDKYNNYFAKDPKFYWGHYDEPNLRYNEHNKEYLTICYYNLKEKYLRGQKDFSDKIFESLDNYYKSCII